MGGSIKTFTSWGTTALVTDLIGGFSLIEIIWTLVAFVGAAVGLFNVGEAVRDLRALGVLSNGRRIIAKATIRREGIRLLVFVLYISVGVSAGLTPARPDAEPSAVGIILVFTSVVLTLNGLLDLHDRRVVMRAGLLLLPLPETQDQREDREFGVKRRELESEHLDAAADE